MRLVSCKLTPLDNLVAIRPYTKNDASQIVQLDIPAKKLLKRLSKTSYKCYVADRLGTLLGYVVYKTSFKDHKLIRVSVQKDWRRSRIGTQLITEVKRRLPDGYLLSAIVKDTKTDLHLFFRFNSLKPKVLQDFFSHNNPQGRAKDGYLFYYQTNGEDEIFF